MYIVAHTTSDPKHPTSDKSVIDLRVQITASRV